MRAFLAGIFVTLLVELAIAVTPMKKVLSVEDWMWTCLTTLIHRP